MLLKIKNFFKSNTFKNIVNIYLFIFICLSILLIVSCLLINSVYIGVSLVDYMPISLDDLNIFGNILFFK